MEEIFIVLKTIPLTFSALFPVVNPIGCSVLFLGLTETAEHSLRKQVARKVAIYTFSVLTIVLFAGIYILQIFGISIPVIEVCGGLVIAKMGWDLLGKGDDEAQAKKHIEDAELHSHEVDVDYLKEAFYPFTFPFTVGPGVIAVMLAVSAHIPKADLPLGFLEYAGAVLGILIISLLVYFSYTYAQKVVFLLTPEIRKVIMKILSFIMVCIGGEIIWTGMIDLIKQVQAM